MRTAAVLLASAASAGASYCGNVKNHIALESYERMCNNMPVASPPARSCAIKYNAGQPGKTKSCADWCDQHGATCVDSSPAPQGKTCDDPFDSQGCGDDKKYQRMMCVCSGFEGVTPSPTSSTPSPTSSTPSPTSTTPSPTSSTPAPTSTTPSPTSSTPAPTSTTPSPTSSTPAPTSTTPSPTSSTPAPTAPTTPSPTSSTPSPSSSTPAPTSSTPAPTSSTPAPTSSTPSPTSSTPAPTQESVSGDPFTSFGGKKTQFYLPARELKQLLACDSLELLGRVKNSGVPGDDQQWFDMFQVRLAGKDAVAVAIRNITGLLPSHVADAGADEESVDLKVVQGKENAAAALARLRSSGVASTAQVLTTMELTIEGAAVSTTGVQTIAGINVTVEQDALKHIGTGYAEFIDVQARGISMKMETSTAGKFSSAMDRIRNVHIDISFTKLDNIGCLTGMLPEIWGMKPMSTATAKVLIPPSKVGTVSQK